MPVPSVSRRTFVQSMILAGLAGGAEPRVGRWRVAIIGHTGAGDFGHGLDTMWQNVPGAEIVGLCDENAAGLGKAMAKLGEIRGYSGYQLMLDETKPDIVAIASRHVTEHRDMALYAIRSGAKGIYMEKPYCRDLQEADEIVAAAKAKNVKVSVAHRNRFHPALPVAKKLVDEGKIGRVVEIRGRGKEDARGGVQDLWVLGSHVFNLAVAFAGEPVACSSVLMKDGKPAVKADVVEGKEGIGPVAGNELHARFEMQSGIPFYFDSIANAGTKEANFGLQLIGTKGIIDLRVDQEPLVHLCEGNPFVPSGTRQWVPITTAGAGVAEPIEGLGRQMATHLVPALDLISAIQENREPMCSAEDARWTIAMIFAVLESHVQGGKRVEMGALPKTNPLLG
ncbi:MAG TPA: Gfo/Idh/MocA family oxidoreductase, partial [Luteolibacter sp.]|nr:Gfo/Idh/MocA family oxidoreductase [Luteolibacter sp.]